MPKTAGPSFRSVTSAINQAHLTTETTFGYPHNWGTDSFPLTPSVNFSAAYSFRSEDSLLAYHESKHSRQRYCRDSNEIVLQIESYFEIMHGNALRALLFSSGMSAVSAALDTFTCTHQKVYLQSEVYRKVRDYAEKILRRITGVTVRTFSDLDDLDGQDLDNALIWVEAPSNPHLRIHDYQRLADIKAASDRVIVVIDNTFCGLLNYRYPEGSYDALIHSCTKYVGGHNDVIAGLALLDPRHYAAVWDRRSFAGGMLDPMTAYLLSRSLRTYDLRIERQVGTAEAVLAHLETQPEVHRLFYPGRFENADQAALFAAYHDHGGAVISFVTGIDRHAMMQRIGRMVSTKMAPSFGSVDSLIEVPSVMSHHGKSEGQLAAIGLEPNLVRLSIGCEPLETILSDLDILLAG